MVKNLPANAGDTKDTGLIPGSGRDPERGNGNPLQYSCLKNLMDRGAWQATVHEVTKSRIQLSTHTHLFIFPYYSFNMCNIWKKPNSRVFLEEIVLVFILTFLSLSKEIVCYSSEDLLSVLLISFILYLLISTLMSIIFVLLYFGFKLLVSV